MSLTKIFALAVLGTVAASTVCAEGLTGLDAATAFGRRAGVAWLTLSPDASSVAYLAPDPSGPGSVAVTLPLSKGAKASGVLFSDGKPFRLRGCGWISKSRLVCSVYAVEKSTLGNIGFVAIDRLVAVNADGSNLKVLSTRTNEYSRGVALGGGAI